MGERTVMGTTDVSVLTRRIQELEKENARLKAILDKNGIEYESFESKTCKTNHLGATAVSTHQLTLQEKVALFQSLFQGREDVFARRWYSSTTQKSGYQPVCTREWNREFCDKRKYKCADCPNRQFAPLAYNDFFNHLAGKDAWGRDVIGLYPIRKDNTCSFLCTDFDDKSFEHGYKNDVLAFVNVCKTWNVPCYIERSRSGNGAHAWIFFDTPVTAFKARKLGNAILTEAMSCDAHLSFKSYDRFFPNQDTLPKGGLGNLVALPLQGMARRKGNSVFVDEDFNAYADQWEMLSQIHKLSEVELDLLLQLHAVPTLGELSKTCEEKPWEIPHMDAAQSEDYPKQIVLTRANMLYVPLASLSAKCVNVFKRIAAFRNPEFYEKQGMRLSTYNIPRIISCSEMTDDYLALPRGCEDAVSSILTQHGVKVAISDKTNHGHNINVTFRGSLREGQQNAMEAFAGHNIGTLSATTAFGKTVFAIGMLARRKVNTLILVHNKALLEQWKERLGTFLKIDETIEEPAAKRGRKKNSSVIGCLYAGKNEVRIYDYVDVHVPLCDSMYRKRLKGYLRAGYGKYVTSFTLDKNPQELIYERNNYEAIFRNDLAKAQYSVIIAVPKIKFKYKPVIMSTLANIIHNGVTVAVHIKEEGANEIELKNTGMDVVCNMEQTLQCAIIDKSIVWYGNINFFGYNSETNNVIRIADHKIANEMIEILYSCYLASSQTDCYLASSVHFMPQM